MALPPAAVRKGSEITLTLSSDNASNLMGAARVMCLNSQIRRETSARIFFERLASALEAALNGPA